MRVTSPDAALRLSATERDLNASNVGDLSQRDAVLLGIIAMFPTAAVGNSLSNHMCAPIALKDSLETMFANDMRTRSISISNAEHEVLAFSQICILAIRIALDREV